MVGRNGVVTYGPTQPQVYNTLSFYPVKEVQQNIPLLLYNGHKFAKLRESAFIWHYNILSLACDN